MESLLASPFCPWTSDCTGVPRKLPESPVQDQSSLVRRKNFAEEPSRHQLCCSFKFCLRGGILKSCTWKKKPFYFFFLVTARKGNGEKAQPSGAAMSIQHWTPNNQMWSQGLGHRSVCVLGPGLAAGSASGPWPLCPIFLSLAFQCFTSLPGFCISAQGRQ